MKKIYWIMAILLIWAGSANAGVLKVKIPADDFEQMKSRLEALEKENNQLQQEVKSLSDRSSEAKKTSDAKELESKISALTQKNNKLKKEIESMTEASSNDAASAERLANNLDTLGRENRQLKKSVATLKESGATLRSDRRTARHVYYEASKKLNNHIFK